MKRLLIIGISMLSMLAEPEKTRAQEAHNSLAFLYHKIGNANYGLDELRCFTPRIIPRSAYIQTCAGNANQIIGEVYTRGVDGAYHCSWHGRGFSIPFITPEIMERMWKNKTYISDRVFTDSLHMLALTADGGYCNANRMQKSGEKFICIDLADLPECADAKADGWSFKIFLASCVCANIMLDTYIPPPSDTAPPLPYVPPASPEPEKKKDTVTIFVNTYDTTRRFIHEISDRPYDEDRQQQTQGGQCCNNGYGYGSGYGASIVGQVGYYGLGYMLQSYQQPYYQQAYTQPPTYVENTIYVTNEFHTQYSMPPALRPTTSNASPMLSVINTNVHATPSLTTVAGTTTGAHGTPGLNLDAGGGTTVTTNTNDHGTPGTGGNTQSNTTPGLNQDARVQNQPNQPTTQPTTQPGTNSRAYNGHYEGGRYVSAQTEQIRAQKQEIVQRREQNRQKAQNPSYVDARNQNNNQRGQPQPQSQGQRTATIPQNGNQNASAYVSGKGTRNDPYILRKQNSPNSGTANNSRNGSSQQRQPLSAREQRRTERQQQQQQANNNRPGARQDRRGSDRGAVASGGNINRGQAHNRTSPGGNIFGNGRGNGRPAMAAPPQHMNAAPRPMQAPMSHQALMPMRR